MGVRPSLVEAGAREVGEIFVFGDTHAAPFEDLAVAGGADEAHRPVERVQRLDPRLSAGRHEIISVARQPDPGELPFDRIGGARRVGQ